MIQKNTVLMLIISAKKKITNAPEFALLKWTWLEYTNEYLTKDRIYKVEIDIYKTGGRAPVERIVLENEKAGE
jgi:hypothetical protein